MNLVVTREPGGTPTALKIRQLFNAPPLEDPLTMESEVLLVSASRSQHVKNKIIPALDDGKWVLCDRFADSSRIYQGVVGGVNQEFLEKVIAETTYGVEPDLTLLLDCPVEVSQGRLQKRGKCEAAEDGATRYDEASLELHQGIRQGFLSLAKKHPKRFKVVDASGSPEQVVEQAITCLEGLVNGYRTNK